MAPLIVLNLVPGSNDNDGVRSDDDDNGAAIKETEAPPPATVCDYQCLPSELSTIKMTAEEEEKEEEGRQWGRASSPSENY